MANLEWVIKDSDKIEFYTHLNQIIEPIRDELSKFKWMVSNLEYLASPKGYWPVNLVEEYFILSNDEFLILADPQNNAQMIWGVFLAIPVDLDITIRTEDIPFADGNSYIWEPGNIQHPDSQIEVISFDSSCTLVKFCEERLSNKFKAYFPEAIELELFNKKFVE